jgi:hypothetical protein
MNALLGGVETRSHRGDDNPGVHLRSALEHRS